MSIDPGLVGSKKSIESDRIESAKFRPEYLKNSSGQYSGIFPDLNQNNQSEPILQDATNTVIRQNIDSNTSILGLRKVSTNSREHLLDKRTGWKSLSSLEKSLSVALALVSLLAIALMIAVIIVGVKLNKDDYKALEKPTPSTELPPWVTTILTSTTRRSDEVTTRERPTTQSTTPEMDSGHLCTTDQCLQVVMALDTAADPCDDFYQFACGGWILENPASADFPLINQFSKMQDSLSMEIKEILEFGQNEDDSDVLVMAKQFFETCVNDTEENLNSTDEIRQLIEDMLSPLDNDNENLMPVLARLKRELNGNYIFSLRVDLHIENKSQSAIYLSHPDLKIAETSFKSLDNTSVDDYNEFIVELWTTIFPEDWDTVYTIAKSIMDFEKNLLQISFMNTDEESFAGVEIHSVDFSSTLDFNETWRYFQNEVLETILQDCNMNGDHQCDEDAIFDVILEDTEYFKSIDILLNETDPIIIENYLKWRIMLDYGIHSNATLLSLYNQKIERFVYPRPRWEMCVKEATKLFSPAIASEYIKQNVEDPVSFKQQIFAMADHLRKTVLDMTQELSWIANNDTRALVSKKLEEMQIFSVFPLSLVNENATDLLDSYSELNVTNSSSHFQNILDLTKWWSENEIKMLWDDVEKIMTMKRLSMQTEVEPSYSLLANSLYLPLGAFRAPLYRHLENDTMALNYGSMGMLIGRQLIKAFEETAVAYFNGIPNEMWDPETVVNFENSTNCLKTQYGNVYNDTELNVTILISGERTVKANSLDVGGFKVALKSYTYSKSLLQEQKIQGLDYSPDQLFYIGFAQNWCTSYTVWKLLEESEGSQPPARYRVRGVLENAEEFSVSWNCPKTTTSTVCDVW